ncbi:MAG TPA: methyltransferase domain-containing protein [Bacteroidales bacterium]|nr:methyltransferase domain-containing protein [Bacteroidales bacterium]HPT01553.1 methyltransferase domain-containing protein [Bacteroidales bacterium]
MKFEKIIPILKGIILHLPGVKTVLKKSTGGTNNSRYCYSVWLRHLAMLAGNNSSEIPSTVAELGPGDSPGTGLAALLSGCKKYHGLDVVRYWDTKRNLQIFDELTALFKGRAPIPDSAEFPSVRPEPGTFAFPSRILTDALLSESLSDDRLEAIRREICHPADPGNKFIFCQIPWFESDTLDSKSVDFIFSQAVLGCVDDLENTYLAMSRWLKPGGYMSHTIDFKSHGITKSWNGYWTFNDLEWALAKGGRPFLMNRFPYSQHIALHQKFGFKILAMASVRLENHLPTHKLFKRYKPLNTEELTTGGIYVLSRKEP